MRKLLIGLLCLTMVICAGAGSLTMFANAEDSVAETEETSNNHSDEFLLGSWVSHYYHAREDGGKVASLSEQTKALADAGLNLITYGAWCGPEDGVTRDITSVEWWKTVDKIMKENNMYYTFSSLDGMCSNENSIENTTDEAVRRAESIVPNLDNLMGIMVKDEPSISAMADLGEWSKKYVGLKDGIYPFVNLLPSYASSAAIGESYYDYLDTWVQAVGVENQEYLSHDFYAFHEKSTNMNIFADMEDMRKVGLKYDLKTHGFPQALGWDGMRCPTVDEIRWNDYAYLAYGFKALSYFNWIEWGGEGNNNGLINRFGEIENRQRYDGVIELNWELRALSDIIMNVDCLHAYHTRNNVAGVEVLPNSWLINPTTNTDLIISYMQARDNTQPYFMIFNRSFTDSVTAQSFLVDKYSGITGLEYFNPNTGKYEDVAIENGAFTLSLRPGEGKYLRIKGDVSLPEALKMPEIDLEAGCYLGQRTVTLTASDKTDKIYYTLDGSFPTPESNLYTEPFEITAGDESAKNILLRAIAVRGNEFSDVAERSYLIVNENGGYKFAELENINKQGDWTLEDGVIAITGKLPDSETEGPDLSKYQSTTYTAAELYNDGRLAPVAGYEEWTVTGTSIIKGGWTGFPRRLEYTFTGVAVSLNFKGHENGCLLNFYLDDNAVDGNFDTAAYDGPKDLVVISGLANKEHKLIIEIEGYDGVIGRAAILNSITVYTSDEESEDPVVNTTRKNASTAYNDGTLYLTKDGDSDATPSEAWIVDGNIIKKGCWTGFARTIYYDFTGTNTSIQFICNGIGGVMEVYIDGVFKESVDTSVTDMYLTLTVWAGENGSHTVKIKGVASNDQSKWLQIASLSWSDAPITETDSGVSSNAVTKEYTAAKAATDGLLTFPGEPWTLSGNSYTYSGWTGFPRQAVFTFTGVGVKVNMQGGSSMGWLQFYIDGVLQEGTYDPSTYTGRKDLFCITGLEAGEHTLMIELPGYMGVTGKTVQLNGFTVITSETYNIYQDTSLSEFKNYLFSSKLDLTYGAAGFYMKGPKKYVYITIDTEGIVRVTSKTGCIGYAEATVTDITNIDFMIFTYNGYINVYVDGNKVLTVAMSIGKNRAALYAADMTTVSFKNTSLNLFTVETVTKTEAIVDFETPEMAILEPKTSEADALSALPGTVNLILSDGSKLEVNVTWASDDYDVHAPGKYRFVATISDTIEYDNPFNIPIYAYAFLCEEVDYTELDRVIALKESLSEKNYTAASWAAVEDYYAIALATKADKTNFTNQIAVAASQLEAKINALENPSLNWTSLDAVIAEIKAVDLTLYTEVSGQELGKRLYALENMSRFGLIEQKDIDNAAFEGRKAIAELDPLVVTSEQLSTWVDVAEEAIASGKYTEESVAALQAVLDKIAGLKEKEGKSVIAEVKDDLNRAYLALTEKGTDSASDSSSIKDSATESKGCNSALVGYPFLAVLGVLGIALKKKKRD